MNKILRIEKADKIILPELSYKIVGAAFNVFNELGWGFTEKDYQRALVEELRLLGLESQREVYISLEYKAKNIGKYFNLILRNIILLILLNLKVFREISVNFVLNIFGI